MPDLVNYYAKRANEYERIYQKPERQADLVRLKDLCAEAVAGQNILEIACGTGYWTQAASRTAKSIVATDINEETLRIARAKTYDCEVGFQVADACNPGAVATKDFTAGMAMAWWSHLPKSQIVPFLNGFHRVFKPGSLFIFMDNRFVAGSSTPISRIDEEGNTYQLRRLDDGTEHEVLKNFPAEKEVKNILSEMAPVEIQWTELPYYWFLTYRLGR